MGRNTSHELYGVRISGEVYNLLRDLRDNCPRNIGSVDIDVAISLITCRRRDFISSYDQLNEVVTILSRICGDTRRFVATRIMEYYAANFPSKVDAIQSFLLYMPTDTTDAKQLTEDGDKTQPASAPQGTGAARDDEADELDSDEMDNALSLKDASATSSVAIGRRRQLSKLVTRGQKALRSQVSDISGMKLSTLLSTALAKPIRRAQLEARREYSKQIDESRACYGCPIKYEVEFQDSAIKSMEHELRITFAYLQKPVVAHTAAQRHHFFIPGNTLFFCNVSLPIIYPSLGTIMAAPADFLCRPRLPLCKVPRTRDTKIPQNRVSAYLYDPYLLDYTRHNDADDPADLRVELRPAWAQTIDFMNAGYESPGELLWRHPMYKLITQKPVPEHHSLIDLTGCYVPADALFDSLTTELINLAKTVTRYQKKRMTTALRKQAAQRKQPITLPSIFNDSSMAKNSQNAEEPDASGGKETSTNDTVSMQYDSTDEDEDEDENEAENENKSEDDNASTHQLYLSAINLLERLQWIIFFPPFRMCVDQRHFGNVSRFVRFVENPFDATCYVKAVGVSGSTRLQLHAAKDLPANAELTLHAGTFSWMRHDSELMQWFYILESYIAFVDNLVLERPWKRVESEIIAEGAHELNNLAIDSAMIVTLAELRLQNYADVLLKRKKIDFNFIEWLSQQLQDVGYTRDPLLQDFRKVHISLYGVVNPKDCAVNTTNLRCNALVNAKNIFTHDLHSYNCAVNIATADTGLSINGYYLYNYFLVHRFLTDQKSLAGLKNRLLLTDEQENALFRCLVNTQLTAIYTDLDGGTSTTAKKLQAACFVFAPLNEPKTAPEALPLSLVALKRLGKATESDQYAERVKELAASSVNSVQIIVLKSSGLVDKLEMHAIKGLQGHLTTLQKKHKTYTCYEVSADRYIMALIKGHIDAALAQPSLVMKTFPTYYSAWTPFVPLSEVQSLTFDPLLTRIFFTITKWYKNYKLLPDFITTVGTPQPATANATSISTSNSTADKILQQATLPYSTIPLALDEQLDALLLRLIHYNTLFTCISYGMNVSKQDYASMLRQLISAPLPHSLADSWSHPLELFDITTILDFLKVLAKYLADCSDSKGASINDIRSLVITLKNCNKIYNYKSNILDQAEASISDSILDTLATDMLVMLHTMPPLSGRSKHNKNKRGIIQKEVIWPGSKGYAPPGYNGQYAQTSIPAGLPYSVSQSHNNYLDININTASCRDNNANQALAAYSERRTKIASESSVLRSRMQSRAYFTSPALKRTFQDAQAVVRRKVKV